MTSSFDALGVPARLVDVLTAQDISIPTPIQAATLPDSLAGRDVLGRGRTGSGKTYAFALPLVARLQESNVKRTPGRPRALILAPTRELVAQIQEALKPLADAANLNTLTVIGGVGQNPQVRGLRSGVDILIACPGRLEDLISQGHCSLASVEITVLDEADHMADLGFLPGVRRLMKQTPASGQRLLFSATLDKAIDGVVREFLHKPVTHEADSAQSPVAKMSHHVLHISSRELRVPVLADLASAPGRTVVFTRTKYGAKALARQLNKRGVPAVDLHGNLGQNARTRNLAAFHSGAANTLVATDVAARGIHVDDVALVVHADPPAEHKAYLHRSGRTARAGAEGTVITLMTDDQRNDVRSLTKAAGIKPTTTRVAATDDPVLRELAPGERVLVDGGYAAPAAAQQPARSGGAGRSGRGGGQDGGQGGGSRQGGRNRNRNRNGGGSANGRRQGSGAANGASNGGGANSAGSNGAGSNGAGSNGAGRSSRRRGPSTNGSGRGGSGGHSAASFSSGRR
ncbi:RNA helicase [Flexivirga endophytica]|uniref:RNA helicase n=1 Tax=Flexivirga endophytica TaxID=1849103 RepID=A0A916SZU9_9MICO|nr:DEAD/DEAH box helicase [Flexivirga endophytica]GGB21196.1 RNA helicase [Flexivirga endophytica]GHB58894.1 RNA helicase [Flexivirga endophytica]